MSRIQVYLAKEPEKTVLYPLELAVKSSNFVGHFLEDLASLHMNCLLRVKSLGNTEMQSKQMSLTWQCP